MWPWWQRAGAVGASVPGPCLLDSRALLELCVCFGLWRCLWWEGGCTYDFSSCFFPKFKTSAKAGFSWEKTYLFSSFRPQNRGGGSSYPSSVQKYQKPRYLAYFGVFLLALGWSCRTVLHTSVPAHRGILTESPIFFGFSGPEIGMGGFLPPELSPKPSKNPRIWPILEYFRLLWGGAAEQCCTPVYL